MKSNNRGRGAIAWLFVALLWSSLAHSAGFDSTFQVRIGYYNADGLLDLHVSSPRSKVIPTDDIPIVIPPPVAEFMLSNNGDGTFTLAQIPAAIRSTIRNSPVADVDLSVRDVDANGFDDLTIGGCRTSFRVPWAALPGLTAALDQIVFANTTVRRAA